MEALSILVGGGGRKDRLSETGGNAVEKCIHELGTLLGADGAEGDTISEVQREGHQLDDDVPGFFVELVGIGAKRWYSVFADDRVNPTHAVEEDLHACELDDFNQLKLLLTQETIKESHCSPR